MSSDSHAVGGEELTGLEARACRWLDANDPLADPYRADTDAGTADFLAAVEPEARWCEEARSLVLPTGLDNFYEADSQHLEAMVSRACRARLLWACERLEGVVAEGGSKAEVRAAERYRDFCRRAYSSAGIAGAARVFRATRTVRASELNCEPEAIGTPDGVVDMRDGGLISDAGWDDAKQWRVTKRTRGRVPSLLYPEAPYDPRWDEFVLEVMCGDAERAAYLKRALGYSVFGGNPEECMFVAYGATTRNGKGTLMESVSWALGDYAATVDHDYLMERRGQSGGADEETASLDGARLVTISEPTRGKRLDEARVKMLTGGDLVSCRHLYGPKFEYRPQFTLWMSCNRLPLIGDTTVLTSGRVKVIPFERHFSEAERDPGLKDRFRSEAGACTVLTWLLEGYAEYLERGLDEPPGVRWATEKYAGVGGSTLSRFVDECCRVRDSERMSVPDFNAAYRAFCAELDEAPTTSQRVRREFEEMGVVKRKMHGVYTYMGAALNERGMALAVDGGAAEDAAPGRGNLPPDDPDNARGGGVEGRIRLS